MLIEIRIGGPLLDGLADPALDAFARQVQEDVGAQALADVHLILDQSIRHPTPYYETQINLSHRADSSVVNDRGIIYGPWLEGESRRNATTRFKGYHAFRRATQQVSERIGPVLVPALRSLLARLS